MIPVRVVLSDDAAAAYDALAARASESKLDRMILDAVDAKWLAIAQNRHYGNHIAKRLFPAECEFRYGITNLFRVELPKYWRMLYTLRRDAEPGAIAAVILDIIDHKTYDKKFNYRKR